MPAMRARLLIAYSRSNIATFAFGNLSPVTGSEVVIVRFRRIADTRNGFSEDQKEIVFP